MDRIKIKISEVFSNLDICSNPEVKFELENSGYLVPCEGQDYVEIIPLIDFEGLAVWIKCSECDECDWKRVVITPCDDDTDCPSCSVCKEGEYCVYICADDEFCKENRCVECDDEHPCENGKICVIGKCQCPPEKPIWNGKECVACTSDDECGKCHYCTPEGCKPKDCICNPATGDCVECMNSGDCKEKDPNMCCNSTTHKCECCEGYVWDYEQIKCVAKPECNTDSDCNDPCKYCDHGDCKPIQCPEGYTCYLGDCVKICDCNKGGCPDGSTCIPYGEICICVLCEGNCNTDDDCSTGCRCGNLKKCIPNPCQGSCENGTDCGEGCGCSKDKVCVPCEDKSCISDECDKIDGCKCTGVGCADSDSECSGTCSSPSDCKGINCTCWEGKCVSCDNFSCNDDSCGNIPGCGCNGNGNCVGTSKECTDEFTFVKDGCGAKIDLNLKNKCNCKDVIFKSKYTPKTYFAYVDQLLLDGTYSLELRKNISGQPLLSDTSFEEIANNDLPISGLIEISIRYYLINKETQNNNGYVDLTPYKISLVNKSSIQFGIDPLNIYKEYDSENLVKSVEVKVTLAEDLKLPNGCTYKKGLLLTTLKCNDQICTLKNGLLESIYASSDNFVDPLFKIYRTKDDVFTTPFRKLYKTPVSVGKYLDKLYGPDDFDLGKQVLVPDEGLFFGNQTYIAKNDCSCEKYASLGKVINCEPVILNYSLSNCNSTIKLTGFTPQCSTNKDLSFYGASNEDINFSQAYWKLFLNGREVATFRFYGDPSSGVVKNVTTGESMDGWSYTYKEDVRGSNIAIALPIETIEFKMYYGSMMVCDNIQEKIENNIPIPTHNTVCPSVTSINYFDIIEKVSNGLIVSSVTAEDEKGNSVYVEDTGSKFKVHAPFGLTTNVRVQYSTGCVKEYEIKESCCGSFKVSANASYSNAGCGGDLTLSATVVGGAKSVSYIWQLPNGSTQTGQSIVLKDYDNGTYQVEATDGNGCKSSASVDVNVLGIEFDLPEDMSVCNGSIANIPITGTLDAVLSYRIGTGSIETITLPGIITTPALSASTVITFLSIEYGGCSRTLNETIMLTVVTNSEAMITETNTQQCVGISPSVAIEGTPNAIVDYKINNVAGQIQLDFGGNQEIPLTNASGTYLVQLTKVTLGACVNNIIGEQISILVQDAPVINIYPNSYACSGTGGNFFYEFIFDISNYVGTPSVNVGNIELISGNQYKVINIHSGESCTITASNGTCIVEKESQAYNCDCTSITVPPPVPVQGVYTYCDGTTVPELAVTLPSECTVCRVDWYDKQIGGNLVASNSLTYTPAGGPEAGMSAYYWAETIDLESGCKSNRVSVELENSDLPNAEFTANIANNYCVNGGVLNFSIPYQSQVTFLWEVTGGTIQGSDTSTAISVLADGAGELIVRLTATNINECTSVSEESYDITQLSYTLPEYDCENDKVSLILGGNITHTYKVTFTSSTGETLIFTGLAGGATHDLTITNNGEYTVKIEDENGIGCVVIEDNYEVFCICKITEVIAGGVEGSQRTYQGVPEGTVLAWKFNANQIPDRLIIKIGGATVLDTTPIVSYSSCQAATVNWVKCLVENGGDYGVRLGDLVTLGGGSVTGTIDFTTKNNLGGGNGVGSANYDLRPSTNLCLSNPSFVDRAISNLADGYQIEGTLTISAGQAGDDIEVVVDADNCGGTSTLWKYKIECS